MPKKRRSPAGQGGAQAENPDAVTSIHPSDYLPDAAISSTSLYAGRSLIGFVIQFKTGFHAVDARGQALGITQARKDAVDLLTATRGVRP